MQTITDARGATQSLAYNGRHLVTAISYGVPGGVAPPNVTFGYDQAGNRSWMEDGPGRVDYTYDALFRMISETRQFDELPGFTYPLTYEYNLANQLTKVTNPAGASFGYNRDLTGQVVCTKCDEEPVFVGTVSTTDDPPREEARWWLWDTAS